MNIYYKTENYLNKLNISEKEKKENLKKVKKILNQKTLKEQYNYAYDLICEYLDDKFQNCNYCEFINDTCVSRRLLAKKNNTKPIKNGCCFNLKYKRNCKYLSEHGCTIKNVACKLHCCKFLRKKGINYSINKIYFVKYVFNTWQKYYLSLTFFVPKEVVIRGVYKRRIFKFKLK